jgi:hypothetical protein
MSRLCGDAHCIVTTHSNRRLGCAEDFGLIGECASNAQWLASHVGNEA